MNPLRTAIFEISPDVRYVATYLGGKLEYSQRPDLVGASSSESDKYEELIVNPTLLKLVTQRGNIDCGGARFVLIRYRNFWEIVVPVRDGHVSVGVEAGAEIVAIAEQVIGAAG